MSRGKVVLKCAAKYVRSILCPHVVGCVRSKTDVWFVVVNWKTKPNWKLINTCLLNGGLWSTIEINHAYSLRTESITFSIDIKAVIYVTPVSKVFTNRIHKNSNFAFHIDWQTRKIIVKSISGNNFSFLR